MATLIVEGANGTMYRSLKLAKGDSIEAEYSSVIVRRSTGAIRAVFCGVNSAVVED